jgi:hypothetical protein
MLGANFKNWGFSRTFEVMYADVFQGALNGEPD